jgi:hypothetical protein
LFVTGIQEAGGIKQPGRRDIRHVWVEGLARATFWKDVRLVLRDPLLLSKILPSALFLLPIAFVFKGTAKVDVPGILGPFAVLSTIMISEQLALIATAGEEGWDLIRMSGASTVRLRIAKIAASMAVPMALCVIMAFVMSMLGRPGLALLTTAIAAVSASAMCWLEVANIRPTPRRDLLQTRRSHRAFSGVRIIAGTPLFFGGGGAVALAASGRWAFAAFATGLVALVALACFTLVKPRHPEFEPAAV